MRKMFLIVLFGLFLSSSQFLSAQTKCKEIIGYYPSWQMYKRGGAVVPEIVDYSRYTILNYSFFSPDTNGYIKGTDPWADTLLLRGRIDWGKPQPAYFPNTSIIDFSHLWGVKVMVSIGGWTLSDNFPTIANDPVKTARFASECVRIIRSYQFDGIDIDWEYPCYEEHSGRPEVDKKNFTTFMRAIRDSLDVLDKEFDRHFLLTAAFGAYQERMECIEYSEIVKFMDYVNMMTYDFNGSWNEEANHNSPLYNPEEGPAASLDQCFKLLTKEYGVPAEKINLGVAFYGRTLRGFKDGKPALFAKSDKKVDDVRFPIHEGMPMYFRIHDELADYEEKWDDVAKVPYLVNDKDTSFVSYDNEKSIRLKAEYVMKNKCAGVIIWDVTGDYIEKKPGSLLISGTPLVDQLVEVLQPCELPRIKKRY